MSLPFEALAKRATNLKRGGINALIQELLKRNAQILIGLQTNGQMYAGLRSDGSEIEPSYTRLTKQIKSEKGQPYDRVTLKDTGSFYKKTFIKLDPDGFEFDSADPKRDELVEKYKEAIFGLTDENKAKLSRRLKAQLLNEIKQRLI